MRKMKESGVEWIGKIPEGWEVKRLKFCANQRREKGAEAYADLQYIGLENIESGSGRKIETDSVYEKDQAILFSSHNILFGKLRPYLAKVYLAKEAGCCSSEFCVFQVVDTFCEKFLWCVLISQGFIDQVNFSTYGTKMPRANAEFIQNMQIPIPPLSEQQAIADYLDCKCGQVDALVKNVREQIEQLKAYKQSLISEVVTKGLAPNASLKDSGMLECPFAPRHWNVQKTRTVLSMPITDGPHTTPELYPEGIPFVSAEAISCGNGGISFDHIRGFISQEFYEECCKKYIPQKNDIYMIKSGATTGRVSIVNTNKVFTIWSPLAVFRCNSERMYCRFLYYFLQSDVYQKQVQFGWTYGTQQNIGMRTLERLKVFVPPLSEQQAIADYLDAKCGQIDRLIGIKQRKIAALEQYKKSLIYEVVTGKRMTNYEL